MRVVLYESSDTSQPSQSTRCFITVNDTEFSHTDWEFFITTIPRIEDQAMPRAVHRLECPFFLFDVKDEHVVFVVLPMAGSLPEFAVEHVGRYD